MRTFGFVLLLLAVGAAWLWPLPGGSGTALFCVACGSRELARGILAGLLCVPLGCFVWRAAPFPRALLAAAITALALLEGLQAAVPGRHASLAGFALGALGCLGGAALCRTEHGWLNPARGLGDRMGMVAAVLAAGTFPLTAWLGESDLPAPPYSVEWETDRPAAGAYTGDVVTGGVGPLYLPPGPTGNGDRVKGLLERGSPLMAVVEIGPPPDRLAQLIGLYDTRDRLVSRLGVEDDALVFRERTRADRLRLDSPDIRARGLVEGLTPTDTARIGHTLRGRSHCFIVNRQAACGYGIAGTHGWRYLHALNDAPPWLLTTLSAGWIALLLFPVGYWARARLAIGAGAAVAAYAWMGVPAGTGLISVPPLELLGAVAGIGGGLLVRRWAAALRPTSPRHRNRGAA